MLAGSGAVHALESQALPSREWGTIELFLPPNDVPPRGVVMVFSGTQENLPTEKNLAQRLRDTGYAAALVDTRALIAYAQASTSDCLDLASIGQWLSQTLQQRLGMQDYQPALLIGFGKGAWAVHALLAQSSPEVFQAGLSVDFTPGNPTQRALCAVPAVMADRRIPSDAPLHGRWALGATKPLDFDRARFARQAAVASQQPAPWLHAAPDAERLALDFVKWAEGGRQAKSAMPVIDLPATQQVAELQDVLAVFISGDGGWRDIDQQVGRELAASGVHVLGIDALRYFWRKRSAQDVAADLSRLLEQQTRRSGQNRPRLMFIGYSFGANILPAVYRQLAPAWQQQVVLSVLLSPELRTDFEIHMSGWLGVQAGKDALPILPDVLVMPAQRVLCVQGVEEGAASLCAQSALKQAGVEVLTLAGGHHYDKDYRALAQRILAALRQRLQSD